jgi:protein CpxP
MKKIAAVAFLAGALSLASGAFAQQNSSAPQNPGQPPNQMPNSTQPAPSAQQPSTPPQAGQQNAPSPGNAAPSQRPQMPSLDEQVATLSQFLNLTADQQTQAKTILQDQHQQAMTIVNDQAASRDQKMQKIMALREATITKVRGILTDEQKPKFDQMVEQQNQQLKQHMQGQDKPNNPGPPK